MNGNHHPDDYYALPGIDADATAGELRRAWRGVALRWHPDQASPGATATFQTVSALNALLACGVTRRAEGDTAGSATQVKLHRAFVAERGTTDELYSAWLAVRPGVADGALLAPSAQLLGMVRPVSFRVRIRGAP